MLLMWMPAVQGCRKLSRMQTKRKQPSSKQLSRRLLLCKRCERCCNLHVQPRTNQRPQFDMEVLGVNQ